MAGRKQVGAGYRPAAAGPAWQAIDIALLRLRADLPRGARLVWQHGEGDLYLELLRVPQMREGCGTKLLARFLAVADRHRVPTRLVVEASHRPGEPATYDLVRWYHRFGFVFSGVDDQGACQMRRAPRPAGGGVAAVLADHAAAKAAGDLLEAQFEAWRQAYAECRAQSGPPSWH